MIHDLRYALRCLWRAPTFTVTAVITIALAIAVNTLVFTLVNSLLWRRLPVRDPEHVVRIFPVDADGHQQNVFSYPEYVALSGSPSLSGLAAYIPFEVTAPHGDSVRMALAYAVSSTYFPLLGITLERGRSFTAEEERDPGARVVLISHSHWTRAFDRAEDVTGRTTTLNGQTFTIVGVGPATFMGTEPLATEFWVPLAAHRAIDPGAGRLNDPVLRGLLVVGRITAEARLSAAEQSLSAVAVHTSERAGGASARLSAVRVVPATFFHENRDLRQVIVLMMGTVALVLVIACANVANLVLARVAGRSRELAVRVALGAGRWRVIRHLLAESLLVAAAAGAAGLLLSGWIIRVLYPIGVSLLPFQWAEVVLDLTPDLRVLAFTAVLAAVAAAAFGLAPLLRATTGGVSAGLRDQAILLGGSMRGSQLRRALVVLQIAVCFMLLACAATAARSLQRTSTLDLGFVTAGVVHTSVNLIRHDYTQQAAADFYRDIDAYAASLPGVRSIALTDHVPLAGGVKRRLVSAEGHDDVTIYSRYTAVSPSYFATLGIPIMQGRNFSEHEAVSGAPVVIISQALARRFWPDRSPLGLRVMVRGRSVPLTVIGVVRDAAESSIWREKEISLYESATESSARNLQLLVRTDGDVRRLAEALRGKARQLDPAVHFAVTPLDDLLALWILPSRVTAIAAAVLGAVALVMAALGVYGVTAYVVSQRKREIGVRIALGATPADIRTLMLTDGAWLIGIGLAGGLAGAVAMLTLVASLLPGMLSADSTALAMTAAVLIGAAACASYLPAQSASRTDPLTTLRTE